jgi:hypothetical protein
MLGGDHILHLASMVIMIALGIIWAIVIVLLIPSILEGPSNLDSLIRAECKINNIRYDDNLCKRDTTQDLSNLIYRDDWEICKVARFNITSILHQFDDSELDLEKLNVVNCTWTYPDFFSNEKDALFVIAGRYRLDSNYTCVIDIANRICYPDKHELWVFGFVVGGIGLLFIISIIAFFLIKRWLRHNKEKMDLELSERIS